jgi:Transposase DDE domain group 1
MVDPEATLPIEVAELRFRRGCWSRPRRVVLTRRRDAENPQGHLWDAAGHNYAAYVTDLDWVPEDVVAFYDKRADMEKVIHELKEDFGLDRIASRSFGAQRGRPGAEGPRLQSARALPTAGLGLGGPPAERRRSGVGCSRSAS